MFESILVIVLICIPIVIFWFMRRHSKQVNPLRREANRMQRNRNDYLAGYRTRTVSQQRVAHGFYDSFYYTVPVEKSIPCPSQEEIDLRRERADQHEKISRITFIILIAPPAAFFLIIQVF